MINQAQLIAETLDRHLVSPTDLVVYGSAALLLDKAIVNRLANRQTNDIDIVIPSDRELQIDADQSFWKAIETTNAALKERGLYISHIFPEREVVLTPEWQEHLVRLPNPSLQKLSLSRPRLLDLIVSKMGRADARDLADVSSMLRLHRELTGSFLTATEIERAASRAHVPEIYREIFPAAAKRIAETARKLEM